MITCDFYCLTYKSVHKRARMQRRFDQLNMQVKFWESCAAQDPLYAPSAEEFSYAQAQHMWDAHAWSVLHGHLFILHDFITRSDKSHVIVMEDDVHIRKDFMQELPVIQAQFTKMNLDVCMLGYLTPYKLFQAQSEYAFATTPYVFLEYPLNVYGTQMYMLHRDHATWIWHTYGLQSEWRKTAWRDHAVKPADWIITKQGRRACIYPLMAVEESGGGGVYQESEQLEFHHMCHEAQFDPDHYV
jgi:hypothetical protein